MDERQLRDWFNDVVKNTHYKDIVYLRDLMNEAILTTRQEIAENA
jgi:hypothetical protein